MAFSNVASAAGWVETPEKNWQFIEGDGTVDGVYTLAEKEALEERLLGSMFQDGTTGQTPKEGVDGCEAECEKDVQNIDKELDTGKPYATEGEAEVGEYIAQGGREEDLLPAFTDDMSAIGSGTVIDTTAAGVATAGAGVVAAALVGVTIGDGFSELVGWPTLTGLFEGTPEAGNNCGSGTRACVYHGKWEPEVVFTEETDYHCDELPFIPEAAGFGHENLCTHVGQMFSLNREYEYEHLGKWELEKEHLSTTVLSEGGYSGLGDELECPFNELADCEEKIELFGEAKVTHVALYLDTGKMFEAAFPQGGLGSGTCAPCKVKELPAKSPVTVPQKANDKLPLLPPVPWKVYVKIIEKSPDVKPKEKPGKGPNPYWPTVPQPTPNETGPDYSNDVEKAGFVKPETAELPEGQTDTSVGPDVVVTVEPAPGTQEPPDTEIKVKVNPATAPNPEAHTPIGGPSEPGINFPHIALLCTTFPFGIPCWLKEQLEAFTSTSAAPTWSIGPIEWDGNKIPKAEIHLSKIEPIMEIVRPFMVIFGGIGIVFFFYKLFTGTSIGGNENPKGEVPEPEGGGNDFSEPEKDDEGYWKGWN